MWWMLALSCAKSPVPVPESPVSPVMEETTAESSPAIVRTNVELDGVAILAASRIKVQYEVQKNSWDFQFDPRQLFFDR